MKIGDIVFLKSGSPPLTVTFVEQQPSTQGGKSSGVEMITLVHVAWIDDEGQANNASAPEACFTTVNPK